MFLLVRWVPLILATLAFVGNINGQKAYVQDYQGYNNLKYGLYPNITFKSSPFVAPLFQVTTWNESLTDASPYTFLSPSLRQPGFNHQISPMIISNEDLSLVWVGQNSSYGNVASNFRVQQLNGKNYLTFFSGSSAGAHSNGSCLFLDENYDLVYNISTDGLTSRADGHECQVTPDNTVLITAYLYLFGYDLSSVGGATDGILVDGAFQEIVPETGEAIFTWFARDHFPLNQSYKILKERDAHGDFHGGIPGPSVGADWFHINSLQKVSFEPY